MLFLFDLFNVLLINLFDAPNDEKTTHFYGSSMPLIVQKGDQPINISR
jgi:hypothetical protein